MPVLDLERVHKRHITESAGKAALWISDNTSQVPAKNLVLPCQVE